MKDNSRPVASSQTAIHQDLIPTVRKHSASVWRQPVADHNRLALAQISQWLAQGEGAFWLDSGCGTGFSTFQLARDNPQVRVIGLDQSDERLQRGANRFSLPDNALLVRAECADIWRLMLEQGLHPAKHFLLYPNPWPKPGHLKRRWHGHPVFPQLLALCSNIELRTNWQIYAEEFAAAARLRKLQTIVEPLDFAGAPLTDFEAKYHQSGHALYRLMSAVADV